MNTIFRKLHKYAPRFIPTNSDKIAVTPNDIETAKLVYSYLDFYRYEYTTNIHGDILITANFDGIEFGNLKTGLTKILGFRIHDELTTSHGVAFVPSRDRLAS